MLDCFFAAPWTTLVSGLVYVLLPVFLPFLPSPFPLHGWLVVLRRLEVTLYILHTASHPSIRSDLPLLAAAFMISVA